MHQVMLVLGLICSAWTPAETPIPTYYKELVGSMNAALDSAFSDLNTHWDSHLNPDFIPMASVIPANSNLGPALLNPSYIHQKKTSHVWFRIMSRAPSQA